MESTLKSRPVYPPVEKALRSHHHVFIVSGEMPGAMSAIINHCDSTQVEIIQADDSNSKWQQATEYATIDTDENLIQYILNELDEIFDGKASQSYVKHVTQNWSKEPFIQGSYTHGDDSVLATLTTPIDDKLYFAGESFAPSDYATVHGAARSAFVAVEEILRKG